jgi:uncharacterized protein DUF4395
MSANSRFATMRRRVEAQGFVHLDDATLADVGPWLRLAPAICMTWTAAATIAASAPALWALVPFAALGAILRGHPFDAIYNHGIRHALRTPHLPPYNAPRRFACGVATIWLASTALAFQNGATLLGYILGFSLVLAAAVPTFTDFCIPSFIYGLVFGKPSGCRAARN